MIKEMKLVRAEGLKTQKSNGVKNGTYNQKIAILPILILWILLCYNHNMFIKEALISTSIILTSICFHVIDENGDLLRQ